MRKFPMMMMVASAPGLALAMTETKPEAGAGMFDSKSERLTGDWGGARTRLEADGVTLHFGHTSESAANLTGGDRRSTAYADQWTAMMSVDTKKAGGWEGGHFRVTYNNRNGTELGARAGLGTIQQPQEVYGRGSYTRLTQFWYEQEAFDGRASLKAGLVTFGEDFFAVPADFQNLTFIASDPGNLAGEYIYNWPVSQWGGRLKVKPTAVTEVIVGLYEANSKYIDPEWVSRHGWYPTIAGGAEGVIVPVELGWRPVFGDKQGHYFVGAWLGSNDGEDVVRDLNGGSRLLTGLPARRHETRHGVYAGFSQQFYGGATGPNARVFFRFVQADTDTTRFDRQFAVGMIYTGVFGRKYDALGVALGATHVNARVRDDTQAYNAATGANLPLPDHEYVAEIYYGWSPVPWFKVQPNLQYIRHPGGSTRADDAWVVGVKTVLNF